MPPASQKHCSHSSTTLVMAPENSKQSSELCAGRYVLCARGNSGTFPRSTQTPLPPVYPKNRKSGRLLLRIVPREYEGARTRSFLDAILFAGVGTLSRE
jgi:hypothetical protein